MTEWGGGYNVAAMKVLALEISTGQASLALLDGGSMAAVACVEASHRRSQGLFEAVERLLKEAGRTLPEVDAFLVGRGPGAYTGLRVSLTAARGWALPGGKLVWTVSSAAALAAQVLTERQELPRVVVWGEARKGTIWAGCFGRGAGIGVSQEGDWKLLPADSRGAEWPQTEWVEPGRVPQAEWVGRLFFSGQAGEELQPIYLHPAVTAAPRFDGEGRPLG